MSTSLAGKVALVAGATRAAGRGIAVQVDHLVPEQVSALVARIRDEQGCLHVLVNNIWGATRMEWNKSVWESRRGAAYAVRSRARAMRFTAALARS